MTEALPCMPRESLSQLLQLLGDPAISALYDAAEVADAVCNLESYSARQVEPSASVFVSDFQ
jgi:hypothetical protein